jgi:hypothetical protein
MSERKNAVPMTPRPFRETLSLWLVLFLTAWNVIRLWTSIAWRKTLMEFAAKPGPVVSALAGALWTITGIVLFWSIMQRKEWAGKMLMGAAAGYSVWYWIERLIWQEPRANWPFAVIFNLVLLIFIFFTTKSLTRERYGRENKNPTTE